MTGVVERDDLGHMARALRCAEQGLYTTHPNPRVGCVIVNNGEVVGQGAHLKAGQEHAEINALKAAGPKAAGATAYVTLEPCSHTGRTGSCARALITAGIKRVVAAMEDPYEEVQGRGFELLRNAGIEVATGVLQASARSLNPGYVRCLEGGLPYVRLKLAMSLDGRTALSNGASQWITGVLARQDVQKLRARSAALVTGVQTICDDNPSLSVRAGELVSPSAALAAAVVRPTIVLDSHLRIPTDARVIGPALTVITGPSSVQDQSADLQLVRLPLAADNRIDLNALMSWLSRQSLFEVLFECGGTLAGAILEAGFVDELVIYVAPKMLGDKGLPLLKLPAFSNMEEVVGMKISDVRQLGEDIRLTLTNIRQHQGR